MTLLNLHIHVWVQFKSTKNDITVYTVSFQCQGGMKLKRHVLKILGWALLIVETDLVGKEKVTASEVSPDIPISFRSIGQVRSRERAYIIITPSAVICMLDGSYLWFSDNSAVHKMIQYVQPVRNSQCVTNKGNESNSVPCWVTLVTQV